MRPLSIVIPTLNEEAYLPRLLQSISDIRDHDFVEVIIVDGNSSDKTIKVAQTFAGRITNLSIHKSKKGTSIQRNYGARKAKYETIVFLDADTELRRNSLEKLRERVGEKENFIAMPLIYPYDGKFVDFVLGAIAYTYFFAAQRISPITSGMCIITTRTVHDRIKGFDERIKHAEDIDYGLRAVAGGARHYIFADVRIRTSARRLDANGRIGVGMTWLRWHKIARQDREKLYFNKNDDYGFGKFRK